MVILLEVMAQFFVGIVSLNIPLAMLRFISEKQTEEEKGSIYFTSFCIIAAVFLGFALLFLPLRTILSEFLFESTDYKLYLSLLTVAIGIEVLSLLPLQLLRYREKAGRYTLLSIIKLLIMFGLVYYFVAVKKLGPIGFIYGIIGGNLSTLLLTIPLQLGFSVWRIDFKVGRELISYGAPLALTTVSALALSFGDRFIIKLYDNLESVAVYGLAWKLGSMINVLLINSYSQGFIPMAFKRFNQPGFEQFFRSNFMVFSFVLILTTLGIAVFSDELVFLASTGNETYSPAVLLTALIAFGFIFKGIHYYLNITFYLVKTTRISAGVTIIGMVVNLALNFGLIPFFGVYGAVAATVISYLIMASLTYRLSRKKIVISFDLQKVVYLFFLALVFGAFGLQLNELNWILAILGKCLLLAGFLLLAFYLVLNRADREKIREQKSMILNRVGFKRI